MPPLKSPSMVSRTQAGRARAGESLPTCRPMSHQNSGDHGHEMHPQQLVRLVGCHDVDQPELKLGRPARKRAVRAKLA